MERVRNLTIFVSEVIITGQRQSLFAFYYTVKKMEVNFYTWKFMIKQLLPSGLAIQAFGSVNIGL